MKSELLTQLRALWKAHRGKGESTVDDNAWTAVIETPPELTTPEAAPPPPALPAVVGQPVFVDLETQSTCDLEEVGGRRYAEDTSTKLISVVALLDKHVVIWTPHHEQPPGTDQVWPEQISPRLPWRWYTGTELPLPLAEAVRVERPLCAHNALGFDACVWQARGLPQPTRWLDTLPMARAAGLPGNLDALGQRLFGIGKDPAGKKLLRKLMRPDGDGRLPTIAPEQLIALVRYNIQDVALLAGVYGVVQDFDEAETLSVDQVINERGICFDRELAAKLITLEAAELEPQLHNIASVTRGAIAAKDLNRVAFIRTWLESRGTRLTDLRRETVENALQSGGKLPDDVRAVLQARLANSRITSSKLSTAIKACDSDGRLRGQLVYHGAHTGRWSGRGVQPHNLPRPNQHLQDVTPLICATDTLHQFAQSLPSGVSASDGLSALIRPCFRAQSGHVLVVADFAGIEARGVAWCARERTQLALFASGEDNYCDLATKIFGYNVTPSQKHERSVGKVAVLGCGYGMGDKKFADTCVRMGVDLAAANITPVQVVEAYRDRYCAIAGRKNQYGQREGGLWRDVERAARGAVNGFGPAVAAKCRFIRDGGDLVVQLPSGRRMFYRDAKIIGLANSGNFDSRLTFVSPRGNREETYGGKLTENIVQAICRDLLANALVVCERKGLPVVLHVHDEIILEVRAEQATNATRQLLEIMSTPPAWAKGFPIEVEGYWAERYVKLPPAGQFSLRARQGQVLSEN